MELTHIATRQGRLSSFLRKELGLSSGLMNRLKWQEKLLVNGVARHADYQVSVGDRITAILDEPVPEYPAEDLPIHILYEDAHILAVDKPAGMLIHPSAHRITGTLANRVIAYYRKTNQHCAFHPVTRLDRDTFGIVLLAKNAHIHGLMNELHRKNRIQKTYHALVFGAPQQDCGIIDAPIKRRELPSLLRYVHPDGKSSVTRYQVLEKGRNVCKLELNPVTGRTHQLRVHCSHCGFPIVGDPQYTSEAARVFSDKQNIQTQMLCAKQLSFPHPVTGEPMLLTSRLDVNL